MPLVRNPILPGFNADPSILRVKDDYYIATSTFEWYPGVQIHHSKDLANWELVTRPLSRKSQLDMRGDPDSCGVWAPCLTHDGEKFYLVYTDVKRKDGFTKDTPNYIVTADRRVRITNVWRGRQNCAALLLVLERDKSMRIQLLNLLSETSCGRCRRYAQQSAIVVYRD